VKKLPYYILVVIAISFASCGKSYNCTCTSTSSINTGGGITTNSMQTVTSEKYNKRETARLMCEDVASMSSSPSATTQNTCILE